MKLERIGKWQVVKDSRCKKARYLIFDHWWKVLLFLALLTALYYFIFRVAGAAISN
jgi:hypothetical protein